MKFLPRKIIWRPVVQLIGSNSMESFNGIKHAGQINQIKEENIAQTILLLVKDGSWIDYSLEP